jgi:hypothetical protein
MAETKISKKPEEFSEKAIGCLLVKAVKEINACQSIKNTGIKKVLETIASVFDDVASLCQDPSSIDLESWLIIKKTLSDNLEKLNKLYEIVVEDFHRDLMISNVISQHLSSEYLQNYEALKDLKEKQSQMNNISRIAEMISSLNSECNPLLTTVGTTRALLVNELSTPTNRMIPIMEMLLEEFKAEGITITPRVETEKGLIDLFIRTADGRYFAFMLRSNGNSKIKWREDRQGFFANKKGGGVAKWSEIDSLGERLNNGTLYLKKQKSSLMGTSSNERSKNVVKGIILMGETRIDPKNDPALLVEFGRTKALRVKNEAIFYLVDNANLANFIKKPIGTP